MAAKVAKPPKPPKAPKAGKKSSGGGGPGIKQLLLQKGERIGFFAAAALLVVFLGMGVMVAANSPSTSQITSNIDSTIKGAKTKLTAEGEKPPPLPDIVNVMPTLLSIDFTRYRTPFPFFNEADVVNPKRTSPKILPATEAMIEFVMGTAPAMETITDPASGKVLMAVLKNKPASQVDMSKVKDLVKRRRGAGNQPGAPKNRPAVPPGMTPPGGVPGGSTAGGGGVPPGVRGTIAPPSGGPDAMGPGARTQEMQVEYVDIDSKEMEKAIPAQALMPLRMVVVTGFLPYKKQLEEYVRALKVYSMFDLANDLPYYNGLVVERQKLMLDGKEVVEDWQQLDIKETFGDIYARCLDWEPNNMMSPEQYNEAPQELKDLYPYFPRLVPDWYHRLVLPRPKLISGKYAAITLPSEIKALKELKKNNTAPPLKSPRQKKFDKEVDPFGDPSLGLQQGMGGPGGDRGDTGTAGGGRSESGPPGFRPGMPPGRPGIPGGPDNEMRTGPGQPGMVGPGGSQAMPEDAWMFRFIDASTEPGYAYRYRVKFKVHNPNLGRNPMELAISELAKLEELESPWFVIKDLARSPQDEYLYAASPVDPKATPQRVTEKVPPPTGAQADETWLQVHKWFREVRPRNSTRAEPVGDWIVADIKAVRGQYLSDTAKIELPIWVMTLSKFIFRDTPAPRQRNVMRSAKDKRSWDVEFSPRLDGKEVLVVDFEGGSGPHVAAKGRRVDDTASMDVLLMTEDGKLRLLRSTVDLADKPRQDRVQAWTDWLQRVEADTQQSQNSGQNPFAPGSGESSGGGARGDR